MIQMFLKYFVPHEKNDYKPHFLRTETALALLALILIIEGAFLSQALIFGGRSGFLALVLPNTLVDETNQQRVGAGLAPLAANPILTAAAQEKANDMASKSYFAHTSPQGLTPWYWFDQVGYKFTYAGENLAVNFSDSQDVTNAWMNSPDHRANILNGHYTEIGIATAQGTYQGQPTVYVVQLFGRPAALKIASVTPPPATPLPAPTPAPTKATTTTTKPPVVAVAPKPTPKPKPVPVIVPTSTASTSLPQQNFVAVEGSSTDAAGAPIAVSGTVAQTGAGGAPGSTAPAAAQSTLLQRIFSAPRTAVNVVYVGLGFLVTLALFLKVFVRMERQHPRLVLNGLALLLVLGTLAIFNHQLLLAHAKIF